MPKRPAFNSEANKLKQAGTDLAHKVSFQEIFDIVKTSKNGDLSKKGFRSIMNKIDPKLKTPAEDFIKGTMREEVFLKIANSAPRNLRAGDPSTNRAIGPRFDPNTNRSAQKPFRREGSGKRSRSPSPHTRGVLEGLVTKGRDVVFYLKNGRAQSSASESISKDDLKESLEDSLSMMTGRTEKLTTDIIGNTFRISLSRRLESLPRGGTRRTLTGRAAPAPRAPRASALPRLVEIPRRRPNSKLA